jgi:protein O-GlcNAc transferase
MESFVFKNPPKIQSLEFIANKVNISLDRRDANSLKAALEMMENRFQNGVSKRNEDEVKSLLLRIYTGLCLVDPDNSIKYLNNAKKVDPLDPAVHNNFGYVYHKKYNAFDKAVASYEECLRIDPKFETAYLGLFDLMDTLRLHRIKEEYIARALSFLPDSVEILNVRGLHLVHHSKENNAPTMAIQVFQGALRKNGTQEELAKVHLNYGHVQSVIGNASEAILSYIKAIESNPKCPLAYSNILLNLHYITSPLDKSVKALMKSIGRTRIPKNVKDVIETVTKVFAQSIYGEGILTPIESEHKMFDKTTLNVGFIGADFHGHAVACFMDAVLKGLVNYGGFRVYIYCNAVYDAGVISQIPCQEYRCVKDVPADQVTQRIKSDNIDILIDLAGHTSGNRLDVIMQKPVEKILSYCGYPNDLYMPFVKRITDSYSDKCTTTPYLDLGRVFLTYTPHPVYEKLEYKSYDNFKPSEIVTLGCFAKLPKINSMVIGVWCQILHQYNNVRLVLKSKYFKDKDIKQSWQQKFGKYSKRVQFLLGTESSDDHMKLFKVLDIHLDTFPYSGTTITTESLYMNVPVLTLAEECAPHVSRVSASILTSMGLENVLVAKTKDEYVRKVGQVIKVLKTLNVREKMLKSEFMDHEGHTKAMVKLLSTL